MNDECSGDMPILNIVLRLPEHKSTFIINGETDFTCKTVFLLILYIPPVKFCIGSDSGKDVAPARDSDWTDSAQ